MAVTTTKSRSPFYPGQPVPKELFVGRLPQINRILERGAGQVAAGKPVTMFIRGEYGIGKSSIAGLVQYIAEKEHGLHSIYAPLSAARNLADAVTAMVAGTVESGAFLPDRGLKIRNWLAKYVGAQKLLGVTVNFEALRQDLPKLSTPFSMLEFLRETKAQLEGTGVLGIFLVIDEIDGVAHESFFGEFLKGIVDKNAMSEAPLPLLLMVCGTDQHLQAMAAAYEPVARLFSPIIDLDAMDNAEVAEFFQQAFGSVNMRINDDALNLLVEQSGGLPRFLHLVGDAAYWTDTDNVVDIDDAIRACLEAADEIGKYVNHQVYEALRSRDYKAILSKIGERHATELRFTRREVAAGLTEAQRGKLDNFLQRMQRMGVIRKGDEPGEYVFTVRLVRLYIWLQSWRQKQAMLEEATTRSAGISADDKDERGTAETSGVAVAPSSEGTTPP